MTLNDIEDKSVTFGDHLDINMKSAQSEDDLEDGEILEEGEVPDDQDEENNKNIQQEQIKNNNNNNSAGIVNKTPEVTVVASDTTGLSSQKNIFNATNEKSNSGGQFPAHTPKQFPPAQAPNQFGTKNPNQFSKEQRGSSEKKRKKKWNEGEPGNVDFKEKKFRKSEEILSENEDYDEDDFLCMRGASPSRDEPRGSETPPPDDYDFSDPDDEITVGAGAGGPPEFRRKGGPGGNFRGGPRGGRRGGDIRRGRGGNRGRDTWRGRGGGGMGDNHGEDMGEGKGKGGDSICQYFMQGKCHRGDICPFSHDAVPPRKMELCKFYLLECCAKKDKCLYMHSDFPCKYYHTGLQCFAWEAGECKFSHGPLSDVTRAILLKHVELAPKEILGDFPRLSRENALSMMKNKESQASMGIPSLFDINVPSMSDKDNSNSNSTPIPSDEESDLPPPTQKQSQTQPQQRGNFPPYLPPMEQASRFSQHQGNHSNSTQGHHSNNLQGHHSNNLQGHHSNNLQGHHSNNLQGHQSNNLQGHHMNSPKGHLLNNPQGHIVKSPQGHHSNRHHGREIENQSRHSRHEDSHSGDVDERNLPNFAEERNVPSISDRDERGPDDRDREREDRREIRRREKEQHKAEKAKRKAEREAKRAAKKRKMEKKKKRSEDEEEEDASGSDGREEKKKSKDRRHRKRRRNASKSEEEEDRGEDVLSHLPKTQRELYLRISRHQREAGTSVASGSAEDSAEDSDALAVEENWYSSDEDNPSISSLVKTINQKAKPAAQSAKAPLLPTPTHIPNTPAYIEAAPQPTDSAAVPQGADRNSSIMLNLPNININPDEVSRLLSSLQGSLPGGPSPSNLPTESSRPPGLSMPSNQGPGLFPGGLNANLAASNNIPVSNAFPSSGNPGMSSGGMAFPPLMCPPGAPPFPPGMPLPPPGMMPFSMPPLPPPVAPCEPPKPPPKRRDPRLSRSSVPDTPRPLIEPPLVPSPPTPAPDPLSLLKDIDLRLPTSLGAVSASAAPSGDVDLRSLIQGVPMHEACKEIDASLGSHPPMTWRLVKWTASSCNYALIAPLVKPNPQDPRLNPSRIGRRRRSSDDSSVSSSPRVPPSPGNVPPSTIVPSGAVPSSITRDPRSHGLMRPAELARRVDPRMLPTERRNSADMRSSGHSPRELTTGDPFPRGPTTDPSGTPSVSEHRAPGRPSPNESSRYDSSSRVDARGRRSDPRMANVDPNHRLGSDPRMGPLVDDYRFPLSFSSAAQDSDLRSGAPPSSRSDTDLRVTPQSYAPSHHRQN